VFVLPSDKGKSFKSIDAEDGILPNGRRGRKASGFGHNKRECSLSLQESNKSKLKSV
jgi:hypothetical protein